MSRIILVYGNLELKSDEVKKVRFNHGINIGQQPTMSGYTLTQTGAIKPLTITVTAKIRGDVAVYIANWVQELEQRNRHSLSLISLSWGEYYLSDLDFDITGLDANAAPVYADMTLVFIRSVSF